MITTCENTYFRGVNYKKAIGHNIREVRLEKGLSQEKLAWAAKINVSHLSTVELGQSNVSIETMMKIAKALNVPFERIVRGVNWE